MERFARLVADTLGVPVALVSLGEADRRVFPGRVGLAEPWASSRQAALAHSLSQRVAATVLLAARIQPAGPEADRRQVSTPAGTYVDGTLDPAAESLRLTGPDRSLTTCPAMRAASSSRGPC